MAPLFAADLATTRKILAILRVKGVGKVFFSEEMNRKLSRILSQMNKKNLAGDPGNRTK